MLNNLLMPYNVLERPVANESEPLEVKFGLTLQQIIDVVSMLCVAFLIVQLSLVYVQLLCLYYMTDEPLSKYRSSITGFCEDTAKMQLT